MSTDSIALFGNSDVFNLIVSQLPTSSLCRMEQVCHSWKSAIARLSVWEKHSVKEGVPVVEGEGRNYKSEFNLIRPITIGFEKFGKHLGKCHGEMSKISLKVFDLLKLPDPFELEKSMAETFVFVVVPKAFKRAFEQNLFNELCAKGDGIEAKDVAEHLDILCSHKNVLILSKHLKAFSSSVDKLDKCNSVATETHIYFMRKTAPPQTGNLNCAAQVGLLKENGFERVPLIARMLFDAVEIAETGTCPDIQDTRTSDEIQQPLGLIINPVIGSYKLGEGVRIDTWQCIPEANGSNLLAVPCILADAAKPHAAAEKSQ